MWKEVLISIGFHGWGEGVLAMVEHGLGVCRGGAAWLHLEIKEDGVRLPVSKGMDGSLINAQDKESSGTHRAETVSFDAVWGDVGDVVDGGSTSAAEFSSDVASGDVVGLVRGVKVTVEDKGRVRG